MAAVWMWVRAEMRRRWRSWLSLALITGIAAGIAIAAAAGARRTATAYPRFVRAQDAVHALTGGGGSDGYEQRYEQIKNLPEVADWVEIVIVGGQLRIPAARGRAEELLEFPQALLTTDPSGRLLYETNRAKVLEGRLADRDSVEETMLPFEFADRHDIRVGDTVVAGVGFDFEAFPPRPIEEVPLKVVGIEAAPGEFDAVGQPSDFQYIPVTPALYERYREILPPLNPDTYNLAVHLRGGREAAYAFKQKVEQDFNIDVPFIEPVVTSGVQKTMRLYAAALWIVAALIGIAAVAILGQTLARQTFLGSADHPTLRAMGMSRGQLTLVGFAQAGLVALIATPVGALVAFLGSPLMPIGPARIAEPSPGFAFDGAAIGLGAAAVVMIVILLAAWPAMRSARTASLVAGAAGSEPERSSRLVTAATRSSASPAAVAGLRMALEPGHGRTAVPVRSTVLAVAIGVAAVTATVTVGRSLTHLIETPALAGFTYDAIVPNEGELPDEQVNEKLRSFSFVETTTEGTGLNINIAGIDSFLVAFTDGDPIGFASIAGRAPTDRLAGGLPEIALGPATARRIDASIGDEVSFAFPYHEPDQEEDIRREQRARVVGIAAIPPLPWAAVEPGEGGVMTVGAISTFSPEEGGCCFVRFKPGTDLDVARETLESADFETFIRTKRADLQTLERLTGLPAALAGLFGVMAAAALVHVLITGIRRRRRDLAVLKTLGFVDRQIRGAVAWQASTIATLCILIGIPVGVILGRVGWRAVAGQFGVVPVPVAPWIVLALTLPVALIAANLVAALPARAAARTRAAVVLRAE